MIILLLPSSPSGDPSDLARSACHLTQWKDRPSLALLNLAYDVTCPDHVAMVITERGTIPCTSVPVVLRVTKDEERAEIMRFAEVSVVEQLCMLKHIYNHKAR